MNERNLEKAALRGEPSYVWRAGQERRLKMIINAAGERIKGNILENGCGVGMYVEKLAPFGGRVFGLEYDFERTAEAGSRSPRILNAAGEHLPYPDATFDLILSHEVLEHVADDRAAAQEMIRVLKPGGRAVIFVPNIGYPFETHGIYWNGKYSFGNKLFVNYLPRTWRNKLAPHVRIYSKRDLQKLFEGLPVKFSERDIVFGAYDNIIARFGKAGKVLRAVLQFLEKTPLKGLGLSHFWVVEKKEKDFVLIVISDDEMRKILLEAIQKNKCPFSYDVVSTVNEAQKILAQRTVDAVVMTKSVALPGNEDANGLISSQTNLPPTVTILQKDDGYPDYLYIPDKINDWINVPFDLQEFYLRISGVIRRANKSRA